MATATRAKLAVAPISIDELLSCEGIADKSLASTGRPRLRKPAVTAAAAKPSAGASDLPAGWVPMKDEDGDIFYYNQSTGACRGVWAAGVGRCLGWGGT